MNTLFNLIDELDNETQPLTLDEIYFAEEVMAILDESNTDYVDYAIQVIQNKIQRGEASERMNIMFAFYSREEMANIYFKYLEANAQPNTYVA